MGGTPLRPDKQAEIINILQTAFGGTPAFLNFMTNAQTTYFGIRYNQPIVTIPNPRNIAKTGAGCELTSTELAALTATTASWAPKSQIALLSYCEETLAANVAFPEQFTGSRIDYVMDTPRAQSILSELQVSGFFYDLLRLAYLGDTTNTLVGSGSGNQLVTNTAGLQNYLNGYNGIWSQIATQVAAVPAQRTTSVAGFAAANAAATFALQDSGLTPTIAWDTLNAVIAEANYNVSSNPDSKVLCTNSVYQKVQQYVRNLQAGYQGAEIGQNMIKFGNIEVIPVPWWDDSLRRDFSNGTKYTNNPHRILYAPTSVIAVGIDELSKATDVEIFKEARKLWVSNGCMVDSKVLNVELFQCAY